MFVEIKNYNDYLINENGTIVSNRRKNQKEISGKISQNGYRVVGLRNMNGCRKHLLVHRLVAETFIPNPNNKPQVNHKDGNKLNNNINNLEWCTQSENTNHAYSNHLIKNIIKPTVVYYKEIEIKQFDKRNQAISFIANQTGLNVDHVRKCMSGQLDKNKSLLLKYYNFELNTEDVTTIEIA